MTTMRASLPGTATARRLRWAVGAALAGSLALSVSAWADQELQEIVVTAEKRESTVQKTPISITAISGADLQAQGLSDFTAVAQQVPGISFKTSGPGQTEFEMRGLTSTGGESPTVGFYLDDAVLTPAAMAQNGKTVIDPSLFDLNRVEVLRGPQHLVRRGLDGRHDQTRDQPAGSARLRRQRRGHRFRHDRKRRLQPHRKRDVEHSAGAGCGRPARGRDGQVHRWMDRSQGAESVPG